MKKEMGCLRKFVHRVRSKRLLKKHPRVRGDGASDVLSTASTERTAANDEERADSPDRITSVEGTTIAETASIWSNFAQKPNEPTLTCMPALTWGDPTAAEPAPPIPEPASHYLSYLAQHFISPARDLVQPYLAYETWLREEFAKVDSRVDDYDNLVPIYNGEEEWFRIRTLDRRIADGDKYLMPLTDHQREEDESLAIAPSYLDYLDNFYGFTHGVLEGLDWANVVVAGSSAMLPLLSHRKDVDIQFSPETENPIETYYQTIAASSDIDLFIYGLDSEEAAVTRIREIEAVVRRNQRLYSGRALTLRTENAITFISTRWPYRHVQIILRLYRSISEILTGFDVDCACVAFDGDQVYSNPRGVTAIATRTNTIDLTRRSPSYENRLWKYRNHNFEVYWDALDRKRVRNMDIDFDDDLIRQELTGLARLLFSEHVLKKGTASPYWLKRALKKFDDGGEPMLTTPSGYASHDIPYGERFTADKVRKYVVEHAREPYTFGTIQELTDPRMGYKWKLSMRGRRKSTATAITFIKENPGRQMIGSFHPLTDDDWTEMAYEN